MFNAFYLFPKVIRKDILSTPMKQPNYLQKKKQDDPTIYSECLSLSLNDEDKLLFLFLSHTPHPASVSIRSSAKSDSSFLFVARTRFIPRNWVAFLLHNVFGVSGIRTGVALGLPWSDWLNVSTLIQSQWQRKKGLINFSTLECINMIIRNRIILEHSPVTRCV